LQTVSQYGNDIKIAPQAKLCDGYLHIVILKSPPFYALPDVLMKLRNGTITHSQYYESICCKEVIVHTNKLIAHIDGEPVFFENGIRLKVLNQNLLRLSFHDRHLGEHVPSFFGPLSVSLERYTQVS
jgi:diacylglycerol kinase family enzyme